MILTDEEIANIQNEKCDSRDFLCHSVLCRAIEAAVLKKLVEQDVGRANWKPLPEDQNERITFDRALHNIYEGDARLAVANTLRTFSNAMPGGTFADTCRVMANEVAKLYTETQYIAAHQRTAEACAKVCANSKGVFIADAMQAIRAGEWWEYI